MTNEWNLRIWSQRAVSSHFSSNDCIYDVGDRHHRILTDGHFGRLQKIFAPNAAVQMVVLLKPVQRRQ